MKALKLIIIFVVIVGAIVGIFYLVSGSGASSLSHHGQTDNTYKDLSDKIEAGWKGKSDWDENLYETLWNNCIQLQAIKGINTGTLIERNTILAIGKIKERIFAEWRKTDCKRSEVGKYIKAIDFIEGKDSDAKSEPNVQLIKRVNGIYYKAYVFSHRDDIKYSPEYNGGSNSWKSFSDYQKKIENEKDVIRNNADYMQYLSNIEDLKAGLSSRIEGKLAIAKNRFYEMLAEEIIAYYKDRERNDDELLALRSARNRYNNEYGNSNDLSGFVTKFTDEVHARQAELEEMRKRQEEGIMNQVES